MRRVMKERLPIAFNEKLRIFRIQSKISCKDVAILMGKSCPWVTKMEKGQIYLDLDTFDKLKAAYSKLGADIENVSIDVNTNVLKTLDFDSDLLAQINFLKAENERLRELLILYMPKNEDALYRLLNNSNEGDFE